MERNIGDILLLHEEIFVHMKLFLHETATINKPRGHQRWNSVDSVSKDPATVRKETRKSRRSLESMWTRQSKSEIMTSTAREAADMARVFGGMVIQPIRCLLKLIDLATAVLCLRGIRCQV